MKYEMDKIKARVSWMGSGSFDIGIGRDDSEDIPLPEEDESLIDTQYIHWSYVNSCQRAVNGKRAKIQKWNTYWLELCGSALRFYADSSLHVESALFPPPLTFILAENETKVAFLELENADVKVLSNDEFSRLSRKTTSKSVRPQVFRRHLFVLKLRNIRSTYIFQAPSCSAMLRWVSKIQESIDAMKHNEMPNLAEERLKLARDMMEVKSKVQKKFNIGVEETDDGDDDSISVLSDIIDSHNHNPKLVNLKRQLASKKEQIWQFEAQLIDFYGRGKGDFMRDEFMCTTNEDYFMVPGRIETFIPAGTKVTVFGQLPNRRWRCVVEMKELEKAMGVLVKDLKDGGIPELDNKIENIRSSRRNKEVLDNLLNNLPDYPLLGCLPTSILNMKSNKITDNEEIIPKPRTPRKKLRQSQYNVTIVSASYNLPETPSPPEISTTPEVSSYTVEDIHETLHDSDGGSNTGVCIGDIDIELTETNKNDILDGNICDPFVMEDLKISDLDALTPQQSESESESASEGEGEDDEAYQINDNVKLRSLGDGIIIRHKLRRDGISIIVGSSSSEDEDDCVQDRREKKCNGITNAVFQKYVSTGVSKKNEELEKSWNSEERCDIIPIICPENMTKSYSSDNVANIGEFTIKADLLHRFGQQSIHLEQDKALAKALVQVFHESKKGPDVKPPRNDRRTLKLSKSDDEGFGFWLQTYDFGKTDSVKMRTFVRYVEDEGPAYLAGLRAGDVIVEVNGQDVEEIEHMKIVGLISETANQLILVVKFLDMVRHVELSIRLKNRQTKLKVKEEELERIKEEEKNVLNNKCEDLKDEQSELSILPSPSTTSSTSSTYSISLEGDLDLVSLDTSTESLGSTSSITDEVIVTTSKFEKYSPRVLDSIKEINCVCATPGTPGSISKLSTTDKDLLSMHSDNIETSWSQNMESIKQNQNMLVHKQSSPLIPNSSLESFESQNIEFEIGEPDMRYDMLAGELFVGQYEGIRTKSYKRAVKSLDIPPSPS